MRSWALPLGFILIFALSNCNLVKSDGGDCEEDCKTSGASSSSSSSSTITSVKEKEKTVQTSEKHTYDESRPKTSTSTANPKKQGSGNYPDSGYCQDAHWCANLRYEDCLRPEREDLWAKCPVLCGTCKCQDLSPQCKYDAPNKCYNSRVRHSCRRACGLCYYNRAPISGYKDNSESAASDVLQRPVSATATAAASN